MINTTGTCLAEPSASKDKRHVIKVVSPYNIGLEVDGGDLDSIAQNLAVGDSVLGPRRGDVVESLLAPKPTIAEGESGALWGIRVALEVELNPSERGRGGTKVRS